MTAFKPRTSQAAKSGTAAHHPLRTFRFAFRAFNERDLAVIELALRLMLQGGSAPAEPEMIPAR